MSDYTVGGSNFTSCLYRTVPHRFFEFFFRDLLVETFIAKCTVKNAEMRPDFNFI